MNKISVSIIVQVYREESNIKINYNKYLGYLRVAFNGIFGFSIRPLLLASLQDALIAGAGFFYEEVKRRPLYIIEKMENML